MNVRATQNRFRRQLRLSLLKRMCVHVHVHMHCAQLALSLRILRIRPTCNQSLSASLATRFIGWFRRLARLRIFNCGYGHMEASHVVCLCIANFR